MSTNIFEQYRLRKERLRKAVEAAAEYRWIDAARRDEITGRLDSDVLTLGVIGQMKCGKSTFLNAFVFGAEVLPAAITPMTAALSVITYGPEPKLTAHFYSADELAAMQLAGALPEGSDTTLAGTGRDDSLDNLKEYVGVGGRYEGVTKYVTIYYPKDYLKGVEIVDTPGFNDPVVAREQKTEEFLRRADAVVLMLYASRAFDATDRDILFRNVRDCGVGKVILAVNKYDIPYGNGETEAEIADNVRNALARAAADGGDEAVAALAAEHSPIPISAQMSLLSQMSPQDIAAVPARAAAWRRLCDDFEISTPAQMSDKSRVSALVEAVMTVIERDKADILLRKPLNAIKGASMARKEELQSRLYRSRSLIDSLSRGDDELDDRRERLEKADRRLKKKIDTLSIDIDTAFASIIRKGKNEMEDEVDSACRRMDNIVENMSYTQTADDLRPALESVNNKLIQRTLRRTVEELETEARRKLATAVRTFCEDTEEILYRFLDDFDARDFVKTVEQSIYFRIDSCGLFSVKRNDNSDEADDTLLKKIGKALITPLKGYYDIYKSVSRMVTNNREAKAMLHANIEEVRSGFDAAPYLEVLQERRAEIIEDIKSRIIDELISPMREQLDLLGRKEHDREAALAAERANAAALQDRLEEFNKQYTAVFG